MKVSTIISNYITPQNTGYTALTGMGVALVSGYSSNRIIKKAHKPAAIVSFIATIIHLVQIEYNHNKYKKAAN